MIAPPCAPPSPWLRTILEPDSAQLDLYCFPHAGGAADSFASWTDSVRPYPVALHAIQLPGRRERFHDPHLPDIAAIAEILAPAIEKHRDRPMLLFGHSLGALIAFETALRMEQRQRTPIALIAAACGAPARPRRSMPIHRLPRPAFLERIGELGGTPAEILADAALMTLFEPTLRADFALAETYRRMDGAAISIPIHAWGGASDTAIHQSDIAAWRECTNGPCPTRIFAGGHFFPHEMPEAFRDALGVQLSSALAQSKIDAC